MVPARPGPSSCTSRRAAPSRRTGRRSTTGGGPRGAAALGGRVARHADRAAAVGDAPGEGVDVGRLAVTREAALVALAVGRDVLLVLLAELLAHLLDGLEAAGLARRLGGEVHVAARAVPVAADGLGVDGHDDAEVLADAVQDVARDRELVGGVDADGGADLVLPCLLYTSPSPRDRG